MATLSPSTYNHAPHAQTHTQEQALQAQEASAIGKVLFFSQVCKANEQQRFAGPSWVCACCSHAVCCGYRGWVQGEGAAGPGAGRRRGGSSLRMERT